MYGDGSFDRMGSEPNLSVKRSVSIDTMIINFYGDAQMVTDTETVRVNRPLISYRVKIPRLSCCHCVKFSQVENFHRRSKCSRKLCDLYHMNE